MAGPRSLPDRIRTKIHRDGVGALLRAIPANGVRAVTDSVLGFEASYVRRTSKNEILSRDDLRNIAQRQGRYWEYGEPDRLEIKHNGPLPKPLDAVTGVHRWPQPFVTDLANGVWLWKTGPALQRNGTIVLESVENDVDILEDRIYRSVRERGIRSTLNDLTISADERINHRCHDKTVFPLVRHPTTNFYHWIAEYLPKLRAFEHYRSKVDGSAKLLIEPDPPGWVSESLELMGVHPETVFPWDEAVGTFDRLVIGLQLSRTPGCPDMPPPADCAFLGNRLHAAVPDGGNHADRVFISRQQADDRRICNFEQIEKFLEERGFETYTLETMEFAEQIRLFASAEIVVAPHGAGLTNLLFSEGVSVLELFPENDIRPHYFYLATAMNHEYDFLVGEARGVDLEIDLHELEGRLPV